MPSPTTKAHDAPTSGASGDEAEVECGAATTHAPGENGASGRKGPTIPPGYPLEAEDNPYDNMACTD